MGPEMPTSSSTSSVIEVLVIVWAEESPVEKASAASRTEVDWVIELKVDALKG
jgi:hypothetical protein